MNERTARRSRLLWSVLAALIVLALVSPVAVAAYRGSAKTAREQTRTWAEERYEDALLIRITGDVTSPPINTWLVNPIDGWWDPVGETWTQPPLANLAGTAHGDPAPQVQEYDFEARWLAYSRWIGGNDVLVTVIDRTPELDAIATARWQWSLLAAGLALAGGLAAFVALGRMQAPITRAHAVNREFIADAAHELRTPLSIIQASAGFALAKQRSPDDYRESLTEILDASERAGASVGELLEFARLEAGQASLRLAPLRLDLLVEEVAASIRVDGVVIEAVPGEAVVVEADYNLMRQVVDNITRNAAARADKVTLTTRLDGGEAVIEVADDGPGFDPGVIDHVFERFRRGDRSGTIGLGMAIARTVVELHGGRCSASNRPTGDPGTTSADRSGGSGGALVDIRIPYDRSGR